MTILSPNTNVFVSKVDLFDYKSGEPPPEFRTILRVIDVSKYPLALFDYRFSPPRRCLMTLSFAYSSIKLRLSGLF